MSITQFHAIAWKNGRTIACGEKGGNLYQAPASAPRDVVAVAGRGAVRSHRDLRCESYNLALKNGGVLSWGVDIDGATHVPAAARSGIVAISAGTVHSMALIQDGTVIAWGNDADYETEVPPEAQSGVVAIAAGSSHAVALKDDGTVVLWGDDSAGQLDAPRGDLVGVTAVASNATAYATLVLK